MKNKSALLTSLVVTLAIATLPSCAQQTAAPVTSADVRPAVAQKAFIHPGLLHTEADFARMKSKVDAGVSPWAEGWKTLTDNRHSQLNWNPRPTDKVVRGGTGQNYAAFFNDVHAAYQSALRWKVSGDNAYADKSISILNAWSLSLKEVAGNADRFLAAGIYGYEFANAAEIMRSYEGWKPEDFERFQKMMLTVFYPMNHDFLTRHNDAAITNYWANWDLCNMASVLAIGVLCDRRDIYDEAITYFKKGAGNGAMNKAVYYVHPGNLGQWQESGRDQGHNTLGIALMGPFCEMAWNQGDDLYAYDNNRLLAGAEYVAKYNLGNDVPFQEYSWGTGQRGNKQTQTVVAQGGRGSDRPVWELIINHYTNRKGLAAPYSAQYAAKLRPEGGGGNFGPNSGGFDQLGFGTLTFTREPQIATPKPSGLTARKSGSEVSLSWWGAADATTYNVKRAAKSGGPYTVIASNVKDLLTYSDASPKSGDNYYVVTGLKAGKETGPSNEVKVSTEPTLLTPLKLTLNGGALWDAGKTGKSVSLNGVNSYLSLPENVVSDLSDFTVSTWVYLNDIKTFARIFDFGEGTSRYMFLTPRAGDGKVRFAVSNVYGYNEQSISGTESLTTGQWVHVAVTLARRTGTLYVNGTAVGSNPAIDFPPFQLGSTNQNWIGRSQFPNDPYLNGKIDDFRIYSGAMSAEQIAALSGAGH